MLLVVIIINFISVFATYFINRSLNYYLKMKHSLFFEISSPLDQFEIRNLLSLDAPILGNIHISITNIGLYLIIGSFIALTLNLLATNYNRLVSNN